MFRAMVGALALAIALPFATAHAAADKGANLKVIALTVKSAAGKALQSSEKLAEYNKLKSGFDESANKIRAEFKTATTLPEQNKIKERFYALAAEYVNKLQSFVEANAGDSTAKTAATFRDSLIGGMGSDPVGAKSLRELAAKAPAKVVRALASVMLSGDLIKQYESAYERKDKAGAAKLAENAEATLMKLKTEYGDLALGNSTVGKTIDGKLDQLRHYSLGKVAADVTGQDMQGKPFKLADYKGKVVVMYFWGTWCPPCRAMIPHEKDLVAKLQKARFAMIGIDCERANTPTEAKKFMEEQGITWRQVWDGGSTQGPIAKAWHIQAFPTIYLLDGNGVIRHRYVGAPQGNTLDTAVDNLLKELTAGGVQ